MTQCMLYVSLEKMFWSQNPSLNFTKTSNQVRWLKTLCNFELDASVSEQHVWRFVQNLFYHFSQLSHSISWALHKFHGFQTSFAFYTIKKTF
jgi:hypothetical protein